MTCSKNNACVYKIIREDNKIYIGITIDFNKRIKNHIRSKRFKELKIKSFEILEQNLTYDEAGKKEEYYINLYDSFNNGLNKSKNGKGNHLAPNFTTRGFKYSEESKKKMSLSAKRSGHARMNLPEMTTEFRLHLSNLRKGVCWKPRKITNEIANIIIDAYEKRSINFDNEYIKTLVKKTDRDNVGIKNIEELKSPNGRFLNYRILVQEYFAKEYNVTGAAIANVIKVGRDYAKTKHCSER
jgi:hypothetical protein